jgi:hypothetical protein
MLTNVNAVLANKHEQIGEAQKGLIKTSRGLANC